MANKPITMNKIKQIIRNHAQGRGTKQISTITGVARNTVKEYLRRFKTLGLTLEEVELMTESALAVLLIGSPDPIVDTKRHAELQPLIPGIVKALRKRGMTMQGQWEVYYKQYPKGYKESQFRKYVRQYLKNKNLSMHFEYKAGEKAFVDYAGDHLYLTDQETGEHTAVEVFVGVLGCSQYTFVEASLSQKKEDFIGSCRRMLEFFGGAPKAIVPDNLKSAVTKGSKYAPILNEPFENFGDHYNTTILPARPRQPKDKSLVEGAVKLIYQRIYTKLESQIFLSLEELNAAIAKALEQYNNLPLRKEDSRFKQFEDLEKGELLALPALAYEMRQISVCTVMKNSHVCLADDKHYYSVPWKYMGKKVKLLYNETVVEVFYKYELIATHTRDKVRHKYSTERTHLSSSQQFVASWSHSFFIEEGNKIGSEVGAYLEKLMESRNHAEQGYKSCLGILNLGKKVGSERLIQACIRGKEYQVYNYQIIEEILRKGLDGIDAQTENLDEESATPLHKNIRGKEYYS
jgi:transposase